MIHIHMGDGIGVGLFLGLFSVPALTLVCRLLNTHTHTPDAKRGTHTHMWCEVAIRRQQTCIIVYLDFNLNATCL